MSQQLPPDVVQSIEESIARGQKLDAIKQYRDATGSGLKESKDFIDALTSQLIERDPERYAHARSSSAGCGSAAVLFLAFLLAAIGAGAAAFGEEKPDFVPFSSEPKAMPEAPELDIPDNYREVTHEGWRWIVRNDLQDDHPQLWKRVRGELTHQLYQIERRVPSDIVQRLRLVPIWIELDSPKHPGLVYHPSPQWLTNNDMLPQKARCVEISNARNFVNWSLEQPFCMMHEMAHAWHHQVLPEGFGNQEVTLCYERAKQAGQYEQVLRSNGRTEKAYALNNPQEYFAEASESFFGVNDFYPFLRAELEEHDPDMHTLLQRLWNPEIVGGPRTANKKPTAARQPVGSSTPGQQK